MRIGLFLLLFPSLAFAIDGCPVGVQLGNVTMATSLPVCLKFEASKLGGCLVDCKSVCVELPLANTRGPVETTGSSCSWSDSNGSGNGDADGSGNTPGEGDNSGNGGLPKDWDFFNPVIGDATGTSVSSSIAKLNKNLGKHIGLFSENTDRIYQRVNEISGLSQRTTNATESAKQLLTEISEFNRVENSRQEGMQLVASRSEQYLEQIAKNTAGGTGETGDGSQSNIESFLKPKFDELFGKFDRAYYGAQANVSNNTGSMLSHVASINGALGINGMAGQIKQMNESMQHLASVMSGGATGGGSPGSSDQSTQYLKEMNEVMGYMTDDVHAIKSALTDGSGGGSEGVDYSKMPGADGNPLSVQEGKYSSSCQGKDCFFDVPAMQKKLDDANKSLTDKYTAISGDVQKVFTFSLTGSADPMECLDLFSHQGKAYSVCPPTGAYWQTLAAIMMFVFYFIALMIIFKR